MLLQGEVFQPPGLLRSTEAVITARTLTAGDNGLFLVVTSGSGTIVADAATLGSGYKFGVYNSGTGSPTFDPTSTQTIRLPTGTVSTLAIVQGQGITFVSDGSNWLALLGIGFGPAPTATVTVYDNAFSILDNVDPTKIAMFQCSSISAGTTRTFTLPDADIIISGSAAALTSGRVPYATTGGLLLDSANLTFNGTAFTLAGTFAQSGANTFSTGTGAVSLNGAVTCSSTLSVTGALSAAGITSTQNYAALRAGNVTMELATSVSGSSRTITLRDTAGSKYNWLFGAQNNVDNGFEITPSTAAGGDTYTTPSAAFDESTTATHTRFMVYDVDNGTLERVSVGTADSGGAGFKLLRIPN